MKYKVVSKIVRLEQSTNHILKIYDSGYVRTVEWLKDDGDYLTSDEADELVAYLNKKNNFEDNRKIKSIVDEEATSLTMTRFANNIHRGRASVDAPIQISECAALDDYDLDFIVEGHLNVNDLT